MANAKNCDRCGEFYTFVDENLIESLMRDLANFAKKQSQINFELMVRNLDLCPECQKSLTNWYKNKKQP